MEDANNIARAFNHYDEAQNLDPYPFYADLRQRCPVAYAEAHGGYALIARYDDVKQVLMDYTTFVSTGGTGIPPVEFVMKPRDIDPPEQARYRKALNPRFSVEQIATKRDEITAIVNELTDGFIERGEADLSTDWVRPLLPRVILPMLGVPFEDHRMVGGLIHVIATDRTSDPAGSDRALKQMAGYLLELIATRHTADPRDDLLGLMIARGNGQRALTHDEIFGTMMIILFGGLDTTASAVLDTMLYLARNPALKDRLRNEPDIWPTAIEEFVRYSSPVQGVTRTVAKDIEIRGAALPLGERIYALNASANHDPAKFEHPDRCMIDRKDNPHLGFGFGAHICLGRNLGRLEMEILFKTALERFGDWSVADDFTPRFYAAETRSMMALPVRFTPGRKFDDGGSPQSR